MNMASTGFGDYFSDLPTIPLNIPPTLAPDTNIFHLSITPSPPPRSSTTFLDHSIPANYRQAIKHPHADRWHVAMDLEIAKLHDNHTWDLVDLPPGRKVFPNH